MEHTLAAGDLVFYRHIRYSYPFIGIVTTPSSGVHNLVGVRFWLPEQNMMGRIIGISPKQLDYLGNVRDLA